MASDSSHVPEDCSARKRYSRTFLLEAKKTVFSCDTDAYDKIARIIIDGVQKGNRNKNKTGYSKPRDNDRSRDQSSIVLGPQKRTWNTGCHVSPTSTQEADNNYRNFKNDKGIRSNDYKRDYRNGICMSSRDRTGKRNDSVTFKRYPKDERSTKNMKFLEEEPEWFSCGPTNVNETIELGGIIDDIPDSTVSTKEDKKCPKYAAEKPEQLETAIPQAPESPSGAMDPPLPTTPKGESSKPLDGHGSRFKHLFSKPEMVSKDTDAINRQLLQLLKGAPKSNTTPAYSRTDVLQVEKKLRAILLGHGDATDVNLQKQTVTDKGNKPYILTLEEIEAQINPPEKSPSQPYSKSACVNDETHRPMIKSHSPNVLDEVSNSIFSLVTQNQLTTKDRVEYCHTSTARTGLNSLGTLTAPMPRYSTATNTVSAGPCMSQIQRTDVSIPPLLENMSSMSEAAANYVPVTSLDMLHQLLENRDAGTVRPLHTVPLNHETQRTNISNSSNYHNQSQSGPLHFNTMSALGRPIVKAGRTSAGNQLSPLLASLIAMDEDSERRSYNMKQQQKYPNTGHLQMCSGKIPTVSSSLYTSGNNVFDTRYSCTAVDSTSSFAHAGGLRNNPLITPSFSSGITTNSSACVPNILQTIHSLNKPQSSSGSLSFLSHSATTDKGFYHGRGIPTQKSSNACGLIFNNLPSAGEQVRPRTLEEIEQFEFLRNEAYL